MVHCGWMGVAQETVAAEWEGVRFEVALPTSNVVRVAVSAEVVVASCEGVSCTVAGDVVGEAAYGGFVIWEKRRGARDARRLG